MSEAVLAIDVGGTKLAAGVVSSGGRVLSSSSHATPRSDDAEAVYSAVLDLAREALDASGMGGQVTAIGVGCGGPLKLREGLVSPLNIPAWRDFPLVRRLELDFGLPAFLDNDALAFALGEHTFGAGRGHPDMLGVVVSTGVGGGVVTGGRLLHGHSGNAGHVGHVIAEPDGPQCLCGARGCVEAIASGPSIARLAVAGLRTGGPSLLRETGHADRITARDVAEAARRGDEPSREVFERAGRALAIGFAAAAAIVDLDLVVVGGGVSSAGDLLFGPIRRELGTYARLEFVRGLRVVRTENGDRAGLIGAAALALARTG